MQKRLAERTHTLYALDLIKLQSLAQAADQELLALQPAHIRRFAAQMHSAGRSARGIALILSGWRSFFRWAAQRGLTVTMHWNSERNVDQLLRFEDIAAPGFNALPPGTTMPDLLALLHQVAAIALCGLLGELQIGRAHV